MSLILGGLPEVRGQHHSKSVQGHPLLQPANLKNLDVRRGMKDLSHWLNRYGKKGLEKDGNPVESTYVAGKELTAFPPI